MDIILGIIEFIADVVYFCVKRDKRESMNTINENNSKRRNTKKIPKNQINKAANIIENGGLVAFPTETVYGLGADAFNMRAVEQVYAAKGRPGDNPLILHVANREQFFELTEDVPPYAMALINEFWPGPLTLVAKKKQDIPAWVGGHPFNSTSTIGVRMPNHPVALAFLRAAGKPIAAPSANKSGRPSPTSAKHVKDDFSNSDDVDMILDGGEIPDVGIESTVVDVTGPIPVILRPGSITRAMIQSAAGREPGNAKNGDAPRSPGTKYRHYAPNAPMTILRGTPKNIAVYLSNEQFEPDEKIGLLVSEATKNLLRKTGNIKIISLDGDMQLVAQKLFASLRQFDKLNVSKIYAESVQSVGIGIAIMDRMIKAAEGNVIDV